MKIDSARYTLDDGRKLTIQRCGRLIEVNVHGSITLNVNAMDLAAAGPEMLTEMCQKTLLAIFGLMKEKKNFPHRLPNCTAGDSSEIIDAIARFT